MLTEDFDRLQTVAGDENVKAPILQNLPAQIEIYATPGDEYRFLFMAKGGGSANKSYLFQETKAVLNPKSLLEFLEKASIAPGAKGEVTALSPDGTITVEMGGERVGVGAFAADRILATEGVNGA